MVRRLASLRESISMVDNPGTRLTAGIGDGTETLLKSRPS